MGAEEQKRIVTSYRAALFGSEIADLGVDGLAAWLIESFCGLTSVPAVGAFHFDENEFFGLLFARVVAELDTEEKRIIEVAIGQAFENFSDKGSFEGLYNLAAIAESVRADSVWPSVARILGKWIPTQGRALRPPRTALDVFSLRETMECAFRRLISSHSNMKELRTTQFTLLCSWSASTMLNRPYLRSVVPALAPMFVLAKRFTSEQAIGRDDMSMRLERTLESGFLTEDDEFPDFFTYRFGAKSFPYAVGTILSKVNARLRLDVAAHSTLDFSRPLLLSSFSATEGVGPEESELYRKALDQLLEPTEL